MKAIIFATLIMIGLFSLPGISRGQGISEDMDFCEMHGMMQGQGMGGMHGMGRDPAGYPGASSLFSLGPITMLDVNQEQRSKLNKIQNELRKQQWGLQGRILDEQAKLSDLHSADRPDSKKLGAVYGALFDIRRQMIEAKIDAMNRAKDVLNKDQLNRLKSREQTGHATGGMHSEMMDQMSDDSMQSHGTMTHP